MSSFFLWFRKFCLTQYTDKHHHGRNFSIDNYYMQISIYLFIRVIYLIHLHRGESWLLQIHVTFIFIEPFSFPNGIHWLSHLDIYETFWHSLNRYDDPNVLSVFKWLNITQLVNSKKLYNPMHTRSAKIVTYSPNHKYQISDCYML